LDWGVDMKYGIGFISILLFLLFQNVAFAANHAIEPQRALQRLLEGNKRFMHDQSLCPNRNQDRRDATAAKQKPFAIVVGCSDSRVSPELTFDQGIGNIFVIRVAGNVVSAIELASVEYSALHNNSVIVMVLGHEKCGAVDAVYHGKTRGIEPIARLIAPAVRKASHHKHTLSVAVKNNVQNSVDRIKQSPIIQKLMKEGKIEVVGAYYHLRSGKVELID